MSANSHPQLEVVKPPAQEPPHKSHTGFLILVVLVVVAIGGGIAYQLSKQKVQQQALAASFTETASTKMTAVNVATIHGGPADNNVELSGQTAALVETPIYARTDGYLKERAVDIGQHVKKGDLLIQLDTPDLDQQIEQARATLAQSKAALAQLQAAVVGAESTQRLAKITVGRTKSLTDEGILAIQELDNRQAAVTAADAAVRVAQENTRAQEAVINANDASVKRLVEQKKYARMEAPFDGVITFRNQQASDVGTLISAGSNTSTREVLRVSQIQTLRVFVDIPQFYAPLVHVNQPVNVVLEEYPGRVFPARVVNTTGVMDPTSRAMSTELQLDNSGGTLMPGMYVKAQFKLARQGNVVRLPAEALITKTNGTSTAVVEDGNKVRMQKVTLGRDYGSQVEVLTGLSEGDKVVLNPPDTLREGSIVELKERTSNK